jgi:hypothetical protein
MTEGAQLVSLNPMRETLEDYFVKLVGQHPDHRADGLAPSDAAQGKRSA